MQQNWGRILRWKAPSQYGSIWAKATRIRPKLKQRKADSVELGLVETLTMTKSHDEEPIRWTSSPEIWWNWWTKKKKGTNSKMKDETYNEEIDKCKENKT